MQFAKIEGVRTRPYKKARAICDCCNAEVIAKCGEIREWHWAHKSGIDCDSWREAETEWHINWKSQFPDDWQEITIKKPGEDEFHRADVLTDKGVVIEFQNSPLSPEEIRTRESFYEKPVWVVNAEMFKHKLHLISLVKHKLRDLDSENDSDLREYKEELEEDIGYEKDFIESLQEELKAPKWSMLNLRHKYDSLLKTEKVLDKLCLNMMLLISGSVLRSFYVEEYLDADFIGKLQCQFTSDLSKHVQRMKELEVSLEEINSKLKIIMSRDSTKIDGICVHFLDPLKDGNGIKEHWHSLIVVEKQQLISYKKACLPESEISLIHNKTYEECMEIKHTLFFLIPESTFDTESLERNLKEQAAKVQAIEEEITFKMKAEILDWRMVRLKEVLEQIDLSEKQQKTSEEHISNRREKLLEMQSSQGRKLSDYKSKLEAKRKGEKVDIMRNFKGQYLYSWEGTRSHWKDASATVLLDTGEDFLFKIVSKSRLKKIPKQYFINRYRGKLK
jgi:hypothetical protein